MLLGTRIYYLLCTRYFYRNVTIDITELNHALHVFSILNEDVLGWGECSGFVDTKLLVLMRCAIDFQTLAQNHWLLQLPSFRVRSALSNHEEILSSCLASMHILTFKRLQFQHLEVHWISLGWLDTFKESVILDASYRYLYLSLVLWMFTVLFLPWLHLCFASSKGDPSSQMCSLSIALRCRINHGRRCFRRCQEP